MLVESVYGTYYLDNLIFEIFCFTSCSFHACLSFGFNIKFYKSLLILGKFCQRINYYSYVMSQNCLILYGLTKN